MAIAGPLRWYALQIQPNTERTTAERLDRLGFVESYSPKAHVEFVRRGRLISDNVPAFPTYLLCSMPTCADAWRAASDTHGVNRLLGKDAEGIPTPLPRGEVETIQRRERLEELEPPQAKFMRRGSTVRIRHGHFVNLTGILVSRRRERARIKVQVFGSETELEMPSHALELVETVGLPPAKGCNRRDRRKRPRT